MRKILCAISLLCTLVFAQGVGGKAGAGGKAGMGGGASAAPAAPTYTGQNCTSATTSCSLMTVGTGGEIVLGGTNGHATATLSTCDTASGTASVTWTVVTAASNAHDATDTETIGVCVGNVTNGGTVVGRMNWSIAGSDNSTVGVELSGSSSHATDGGNNRFQNGGGSGGGPFVFSSNTFTTTVPNVALIGVTADCEGPTATITAGTGSTAFTKRVCTTVWGGQTCIETGTQASPGSTSEAQWQFDSQRRVLSAGVAIQP